MAGIYIHIPYCKTICHYCDFYKTANNKNILQFIDALRIELSIKKDLIIDEIDTIYFGGGTPSFISLEYINMLISDIRKLYSVSNDCEITIEINPDDISIDYYKNLNQLGINRISLGIQSFDDSILRYLNRRHSASVAIDSIQLALKSGFNNLSVDLIYGIPSQSFDSFKNDLKIIEGFEIAHLSAYHLGIEDATYFGKLKNKGRFSEITESDSEKYFEILTDWTNYSGFEHYEVSNFAKNQQYSRHNTSYWFSLPYLGFGPSAHSFIKNRRFFNISNVNNYIDKIIKNELFYDSEILSQIDILNEYLLLRLRTKWGLNIVEMDSLFSGNHMEIVKKSIFKFKDSDYLRIINNQVILTDKGLFVSDFIVREVMLSN